MADSDCVSMFVRTMDLFTREVHTISNVRTDIDTQSEFGLLFLYNFRGGKKALHGPDATLLIKHQAVMKHMGKFYKDVTTRFR